MTIATNSIFLSVVINSFNENTPEPFYARYLSTFDQQSRTLSQSNKTQTYNLDATDVVSLPTETNSGQRLVALKVIGDITIDSHQNDASASPIVGHFGCYGVDIFPGWFIWSTSRLTQAITVTANSDGTIVDAMYATTFAET